MKNILFLLPSTLTMLLVLFEVSLITSCKQISKTQPSTIRKDLPKPNLPSVNKEIPLEILGTYNTRGGKLYVYKFGNDTIFWGVGLCSTCPVSLHVK